jgi:probable HAF family extracellular repeat protein
MTFQLSMWTRISVVAACLMPCALQAQPFDSRHDAAGRRRYVLEDFGTLGGRDSFVAFLSNIMNDRGTVVGGSETIIPDPYAPNCFQPPNCLVFHAFQWQKGVLTDLGALPGVNSSFALAVNERGWAVGQSQTGEIDPLLGAPATRPVLWKNGRIVDLGTLGGDQNHALDINNSGEITGFALNATPDPFSFAGATETRAFLWRDGVMRDLGTLGGPDSFGQYINERGQIAGFSYINSIPNPETGVPTAHPFLWHQGRMIDLGSLGGTFGQVNDLNNQGQVIGNMTLPGDAGEHWFFWDQGRLTDMSIPQRAGTLVLAHRINERAEVVGGLSASDTGKLHAALWKDGDLRDLGTLEGDCTSLAWNNNSRGQIVGVSVSCDRNTWRAFLWENGRMIDLNSQVPRGSSLSLVYALAINERGQITGLGVPPGVSTTDSETLGHAFLLTPSDHGQPRH